MFNLVLSQINLLIMPQFSPLWFINLISWTFAIISFVIWYVQAITFPNILRLNLSRKIMEMNS